MSELTTKQIEAARALSEGATSKEAATIGGVSVRQFYNWKQEPAFKALLTELETAAIESATQRLNYEIVPSIDLLISFRDNVKKPDRIRMQAVKILLDYQLRYHEINNVQRDITEIKAKIGL
jgi:transposase